VAVGSAGVAAGLLTAPRPGPDPTVLAALNGLQNNQREIQSSQREQAKQLGSIDGQLDQTALRQQRILDTLTATFAGAPGLIAHVDAGAVTITFADGVFSAGNRLSDNGSAALADLSRRLGPSVADVSITVVGHTEDAQPSGYPSSDALGLARAMAAAERMSEASGLPLSTFALSSSGMANPPFPNTTAADRARNRTVTVVVRPR
jgi:outer membrane protein OmpA-like peptidoglycan-associated protein